MDSQVLSVLVPLRTLWTIDCDGPQRQEHSPTFKHVFIAL